MTNGNTEMFHVRDSSSSSSRAQEGKKSMELGHGIAASLSPCACFVSNSGILTVWNQKEMKNLVIQNTIAKELCGFCFDSIEERGALGKFTAVEK